MKTPCIAIACLVLTGGVFAAPQEPTELESSLAEVTVYPSTARVVRVAAGELREGSYVLRGLPGRLDPSSVRVRCEGAQVVGVEVRTRLEARESEERLAGLRARREELEHQLEIGRDAERVLVQRRKHLGTLLAEVGRAERAELSEGKVDAQAWRARRDFVAEGLRSVLEESRELRWRLAEVERELHGLSDQADGSQPVRLRDVYVKLAAKEAASSLQVAYLVDGASWAPRYDVRAARDGRSVELGYRAAVQQSTGEDWSDVRLLLSSAEPQRSAQAPELEQRWASLESPPRSGTVAGRAMAPAESQALSGLGYTSGDDEDGYAMVLDEGLSVRFVVPGRDSVASGAAPTLVQVGEVELDVTPEYHCVPRQDTTVWLRGRARNTSRWPLLPGEASVYFGEDYLGRAWLDQVEVEQEFELPLGAADAITCERVKTSDFAEGPSLFGSSAKETEAWRLTLANHGGAVHAADGSVHVIVREALPRPTHDRIHVALDAPSRRPSTAERWAADAKDLGIQTWELDVPLDGEVVLRYGIAVTYPQQSGVSYR